jgi:predicted amidophosphoribosyltransferase
MRCARCQADLNPTRLEGLCPVCLLEAACADNTDATNSLEPLTKTKTDVAAPKVDEAPW